MNTENFEKIKDMLVDDLAISVPKEQIGVEDDFRTVLDLDSTGFLELRFQTEEIFDVKINDADFVPENFKNGQSLLALIDRLQAA